MKRDRIKLEIEVDLDPVPGAFHDRMDASERIYRMLNDSIGHYNPTVKAVQMRRASDPTWSDLPNDPHDEHRPTMRGDRLVCACGDDNCASLDGGRS